MRIANSKRRLLEKKVISLYRKKVSNKAIAEEVGVTEKTVASWLKDFKDLETEIKENIKALDKRLKIMLENPNTPTEQIRDITLSIETLENRLNK